MNLGLFVKFCLCYIISMIVIFQSLILFVCFPFYIYVLFVFIFRTVFIVNLYKFFQSYVNFINISTNVLLKVTIYNLNGILCKYSEYSRAGKPPFKLFSDNLCPL